MKDRGATPVVGVIILVALTVATAGVAASQIDTTPPEKPQASVLVEESSETGPNSPSKYSITATDFSNADTVIVEFQGESYKLDEVGETAKFRWVTESSSITVTAVKDGEKRIIRSVASSTDIDCVVEKNPTKERFKTDLQNAIDNSECKQLYLKGGNYDAATISNAGTELYSYDQATIDGQLKIDAKNTVVSGVTVSEPTGTAVKVTEDGDSAQLRRLSITDSHRGLFVNDAEDVFVSHTEFTNNQFATRLHGDTTLEIRQSSFSENKHDLHSSGDDNTIDARHNYWDGDHDDGGHSGGHGSDKSTHHGSGDILTSPALTENPDAGSDSDTYSGAY